jgi:hypothetical protein
VGDGVGDAVAVAVGVTVGGGTGVVVGVSLGAGVGVDVGRGVDVGVAVARTTTTTAGVSVGRAGAGDVAGTGRPAQPRSDHAPPRINSPTSTNDLPRFSKVPSLPRNDEPESLNSLLTELY